MVYIIAPLGVAHHWMMVKKDLTEPMIHAAILALLLGWRMLAARKAVRHNARTAATAKQDTACVARSPSSS